MRNLSPITFLLCIFLFSSCRTMEKSLTYGNYDHVIDIALTKYAKGKLSDEHKSALARAYRNLTQKEFEQIAVLKSNNRVQDWPEIYNRYSTINHLQEKLTILRVKKDLITGPDSSYWVSRVSKEGEIDI